MRTLIVLFALAAATVATAQPAISVTPASIEFGRIGPNRVDTTVVIANRGTDTLTVERLATSCGCTTAPFERRTLAPGESVRVAVSVDARHKNNEVRTSVSVLSSDATAPSVAVPLHATVVRAATLPEILGPAQGVALGKPHEIIMQIRNVGDKPLTLNSPLLTNADGLEATVDFKEMTIPAGEERSVPVHVVAKKEGTGSATLTIRTDNAFQPQLAVGIYTNVTPDSRTTAKH
jgi:hypothetical protein